MSVSRARLRGYPLKWYCRTAKISRHECGPHDNRCYCHGLIDNDGKTPSECQKCGAFTANVVPLKIGIITEEEMLEAMKTMQKYRAQRDMTNVETIKWIKEHQLNDYQMNLNRSVAMKKAMIALENVDKYEKAIASLAEWIIDCEDCFSECPIGYTNECPYRDVKGEIIDDAKCIPAICNHVKKENGIDDDEILAYIRELNENEE